MKRITTVGSRGSRLAMTQTRAVIKLLGLDIGIKKIMTRGDKITDVALANVEGKGFFTKEIDNALIEGEIDFAVHSYKDVPTDLPMELIIACVPKREVPNDAIISKYGSLVDLPQESKIGTSSLRRQAQIRHSRPDLKIMDLRGNLDTRIRKLDEGQYDAIVLAAAGLKRLGYSNYNAIELSNFIPAAGQGALAIISRRNDSEILNLLGKINDPNSMRECESERHFLAKLGGGCQIPAGAYASITPSENTIKIVGFIASLEGNPYYRLEKSGKIEDRKNIALNLAQELLDMGGKDIINNIRKV